MSSHVEPGLVFDADGPALLETAQEFVRRELEPNLEQWRSDVAASRDFYRKAAGTGLLGILAPVEAGGFGVVDRRFSHLSTVALVDVGAFGVALTLGLHTDVAVPALTDWGGGTVHASLLEDMVSGECLAAVAGLTDVIAMSDEGILTGVAHGVPGARIADLFVVVVTDSSGSRQVVRLPASAVTVQDSTPPLGAADTGARTVEFDGVRVERDAIADAGAAESVLATASLLIGGVALASAQYCLDLTAQYVNTRAVYGRPVAEFGNTRAVTARVRAEALAVAALHDRVLRGVDTGGVALSAELCALVYQGVALFSRSADVGLQFHGGYGYMSEYPISHAYAAARYMELLVEGLPEIVGTLVSDAGLVPTHGTRVQREGV